MASVTLTIPSPILSGVETFGVVIKDGSGMTIFTSTETNAPFTVSGLFAGDYKAYYTFGSDTNVWCFTIPPCGCPTLTNAVVDIVSTALYKVVFTFDFSSYIPDDTCSFVINGVMPDGSTFQYAFVNIYPFTPIGGGLYTLTAYIGNNSSCTFYIDQWIHGADTGVNCVPSTNINYACSGPLLIAPIIIVNFLGGTVQIVYSTCGVSCHTVTWNYVGIRPGNPPDIGTFTDTVTCSPLGTPTHTIHAILGSTYTFTGTDCCGNTYIYTYSCVGPAMFSYTFNPVFASKTVQINYSDCGPVCHTVRWNYAQTNAISSPDSGTWTDTIPCVGLPYSPTHVLSPSPTIGGAAPTYNFISSPCCSALSRAFSVTILP